jgi:ribosomal protein S18 acetylase RimI-like enzyme
MAIRKATIDDLKRIVEIFREEYSKSPYNEKWSESMAIERINNYFKDREIFVLEINNQVQGIIIITFYIWHTGLRGFIDEVVVASEFQGEGYGKKLMEFAENYFKKKGAKEVSLMTSPKAKAFKIYKKLNYKREGFVTMYKKL